MVNPNGFASTAWFEWGGDSSTETTLAPANISAGNQVVWLTNNVSPFALTNTCHFGVVCSNSVSTTHGLDQVAAIGLKIIAWESSTNLNYGVTNIPLGLTNIVRIASSPNTTFFAISDQGGVTAWVIRRSPMCPLPSPTSSRSRRSAARDRFENDGNGQRLGRYKTGNSSSRQITNVVAISASLDHNLALKADGTVVAGARTLYGGVNIVPPGLHNVVGIDFPPPITTSQ